MENQAKRLVFYFSKGFDNIQAGFETSYHAMAYHRSTWN